MTVEIGELRARLVAEATQMKQEIRSVKTEFQGLGDEGAKAAEKLQRINQLSASLDNVNARIELQKKKLAELKQSLDSTFNEKRKDQLQEQILKTEAALQKLIQTSDKTVKEMWDLEDSLKEVSTEMNKVENNTDRARQGIQSLASGLAALGAGAATAKIVNLTKTLAEEANQLANSYQGLSVVASKFNVDASAAADLADRLADRWGLNKGVMADVVKTYTTMNFTLEETEKIITATADAAAYNRQAHLSWDEAIKQVAEEIKAGNSNLTDAAGITTNLSVMQDRYAKSIGTTAAKLSEAQKIQAAYNGMLEEGAIFAGNADTAMTGYTGTQAAFNSTLQEARTELGEAYLPVIEEIIEKLTPLIRGFAEWASENKEVVAGLTAAGIAMTGFIAAVTSVITVVTALRYAFVALNASLGPVGLAVAGLSALAIGVTSYQVAADMAAESTWKFAESQEELNRKLNESPLNRSTDDLKNLMTDYERINELIERRSALIEEYNRVASSRKTFEDLDNLKEVWEWWTSSDDITKRMLELDQEIIGINKSLKELGITTKNADEVLDKMKDQIDSSVPALRELRMETLRQIAAQEDNAKETESLINRYNTLSAAKKLTAEQTGELTSIVGKLSEKYPELHTELDEQGRLLIVNEDLLRNIIDAESDAVEAALAAEREIKQSKIRTTQAAIKAAEAQIRALEAVAAAESPEWVSEGSTLDFMGDQMRQAAERAANDKKSQIQAQLNDIRALETEIAAIDNGTWRELALPTNTNSSSPTSLDKEKKKSTKTPRQKTPEELAREDYQNSLKYIQYKRDLNQMSEQQEITALERLQKRYSKYSEIRQDTEVRIYKIKEQLAADEEKLREKNQKDAEKAEKERFAASSEWITQEERRMVLAGKSEEEIAQMKLEAWSRVRSRYDKDSEYYKQADTQLYNLRVSIIKQQTKAEQDAAKEREKLLKDTTKSTLDAIEKAKKAELAALDDRRKAIQKFYDDQNEAIDDSERLKERNELISEMEKYRYATSEKGQKHFLELQEKLRKMDIEDQKRELDAKRDQELEALDKQKQDIEDYYNELREATSDLTGDLTALYKLADDERLKSFVRTNELIKQEMANLQQALAASQAAASLSSTGVMQSIVAQMQANSRAWHTADASGKKRLEADNQSLGAQIGATYKNGRWLLDGTPLYHSGGIAGEMNFRSEMELMPDEITAILKRGEPVLTPQQVGSLVSATSAETTITIEKMIEVNDPIFEDGIDLRSFGRETGGTAADLIRKQLAGGG